MKKILALLLSLTLVLGCASTAFASQTTAAQGKRSLKTTTLTESDRVNSCSAIRISLSVPNYLGKIKADITTTEFSGETDVLVIYVPNDKWDGNCYYNGVVGTIKQGLANITAGSGSLVSWKDIYSYNFLPMEGGFYYVDINSLQMSFLDGPGLYTGLSTFSYTLNGKSDMSAAGYPFILLLNDDTVNYYLTYGKLDSYASYDWPELAKLLAEPEPEQKGSLANFRNIRNYYTGTFNDIELNGSYWYDEYVINCYRLGLLEGNKFNFFPRSSFTLAQAITAAARIHNIYYGGSGKFNEGPVWYNVYVHYAQSNGIITASDFGADTLGSKVYERAATRGEMAYILANALPDSALKGVNTIRRIPDVNSNTAYSVQIFKLYRAGILDGYTAQHYFRPSNNINRSEAAAIISRLVNSGSRIRFSIY